MYLNHSLRAMKKIHFIALESPYCFYTSGPSTKYSEAMRRSLLLPTTVTTAFVYATTIIVRHIKLFIVDPYPSKMKWMPIMSVVDLGVKDYSLKDTLSV